jgi:hypothetical protein
MAAAFRVFVSKVVVMYPGPIELTRIFWSAYSSAAASVSYQSIRLMSCMKKKIIQRFFHPG